MDYHPAKDDKKDDSRMKSIRLTAKKKMFIGAVAIAACGVSAQLLKVLAPDALDLVYLCLMVFSVIVSVFRVRCSVRGEKGEVEDLSSVLIWSTPLIALFCVVSGDLYTEGFSALLQIEGANVCLAATVALAVLSFAVSAGVRYVKSDDGEGSPPESSRESAGFSTAGDGGGARAKGGESSVEGEDTSSRNKSFRQEIQQPKEVSRKTILAAMVVNSCSSQSFSLGA